MKKVYAWNSPAWRMSVRMTSSGLSNSATGMFSTSSTADGPLPGPARSMARHLSFPSPCFTIPIILCPSRQARLFLGNVHG